MTDQDAVAVGDLNSSARGSGARKNAGKPQWAQFPVWILRELVDTFDQMPEVLYELNREERLTIVSIALGRFQQGGNLALRKAAAITLVVLAEEQGGHQPLKYPFTALSSVVSVLEFGARKYKAGNWAKGMPWSVCISCAISHLMKALSGEQLDAESGLSTVAHLMCNLVFLMAYVEGYPEGDDRPPEFRLLWPAATVQPVARVREDEAVSPFPQDSETTLWGTVK